jgi:hypothetical protein
MFGPRAHLDTTKKKRVSVGVRSRNRFLALPFPGVVSVPNVISDVSYQMLSSADKAGEMTAASDDVRTDLQLWSSKKLLPLEPFTHNK